MRSLVFLLLFAQAACVGRGDERRDSLQVGWRVIGSWSGRGNAQLSTFPTGGGPLRVIWETKNEARSGAGRFIVRLHSADSGRILAEIADHRGQGSNTKEIVDDHQRFYISVESSDVDWTLRVEEEVARLR